MKNRSFDYTHLCSTYSFTPLVFDKEADGLAVRLRTISKPPFRFDSWKSCPTFTMSSCATALIVIATILGPITLVFMAVSFGTDYWLEFDVDRSQLSTADREASKVRYTHTRYRGLFRECYPGNDTACE